MNRRWLGLQIHAPLMAFGAVAVDHVGPTWRWPGRSMLTGLFANALGWDWTDREAHQTLQDRMVCGAVLIREGEVLTDIQNVQLHQSDKGWTTRGSPETRGGGSYKAPHRRQRDYLVDAEMRAVLTLSPSDQAPVLDALRTALERPARPLFLGRKPCLPSRPLVTGTDVDFIDAPTVYQALQQVWGGQSARAFWPEDEGPVGVRAHDIADLRHWHTGLHGGSRTVWEGRLDQDAL